MDGRPRGVLERVPDGVARHSRLVRLRALTTVRPGLHVLLGVIPRAPRGVEEQRHQNASHGGEHEHPRDSLRAQKFLAGGGSDHPEDDAYDDRTADGQNTRLDHLPQRRLRDDGHAPAVIRLLLAGHDPRPLPKLPSHLGDNLLRGAANRGAGKGGEEVDDHAAQQTCDEHLRDRNVHLLERLTGERLHLVHVRAEQEE